MYKSKHLIPDTFVVFCDQNGQSLLNSTLLIFDYGFYFFADDPFIHDFSKMLNHKMYTIEM